MSEAIENSEFELFRKQALREAIVVQSKTFVQLAQMYLSEIPLAGAAAFRKKDGKEEILINWDYYQNHLGSGENFTDLIDFEIDHEAYELWETRNAQEKIDPKGPAHYNAIKYAMRKVNDAGKLDRYMELKRRQFEFFEKHGDTEARNEFDFYENYAKDLKQH